METEPDRQVRGHVAGTAAIAGGFVIALLALLLLGQQPPSSPQPQPDPSPPPEGQSTLLVQVTLDRIRAASLLTASGDDPDGAVLLSMPADILLADGPAYTPLLDANLSLNRRLAAQATANTLGVRVDGGWRMERKALAGLVDAVGGVEVTLSAATTFLDGLDEPVLRLPAGTSSLAGPDASWYVMGVVAGEDPIAGVQARFADVFVQAVAQLPEEPDAVAAILTSLGALSDPLNGTAEVAQQLVALRADFLAGQVLQLDLPLRVSGASDPVDTMQELEGGPAAEVGAFRVVDYAAATPQLRQAFAAAPRVAEIDGEPRVLVWNASSEPLATEVALLELTDAGFVAASAGYWTSVQPLTRVNGTGFFRDGQSYTAGAAEALRIANPDEFGDIGTLSPAPTPSVPSAAAASMPPPDQTPLGDVDVVFGEDYQPCPADEPDCLDQEVP